MKKLFAMLLTVVMVFSLAMSAMADDSATITFDSLKWVAGDVDCDEKIDAEDLPALRQILLEVSTAEREDTADTNKDDVIDVRDLVHLKKVLA